MNYLFKKIKYARLAQLVEQPVYTGKVGGSSPSPRTLPIALVVQWIEQGSSKALMWVRFLPRAQKNCEGKIPAEGTKL